MAKSTKRERKFQAKGGVKAALAKGTITHKGKLKKKKRKREKIEQDDDVREEVATTPATDDLAGPENLGDLDLDSFFHQMTEEDPQQEEDSLSEPLSDDSDDDEDLETAEARMKEEMKKIQETDPDFHKFLKENEESLLEFGSAHDDAVVDDEEDEQPNDDNVDARQGPAVKVNDKLLRSLEQGAFTSHGIKPLKKLTNAYHAACHLADAHKTTSNFEIGSSKVYDRLMLLSLGKVHEAFGYHLLGDDYVMEDENAPIQPKKMENADKWSAVQPVVQTFLKATIHLLNEAKEPELLSFILKSLRKYLPYLSPLPRIAENLLRTLVSLWSAPMDDSNEDYQVVRLEAFFRIRQLALTQPFPFLEDCLKKTYLAYAKRAKFATSAAIALPTLTFMGNCLVELYSMDSTSSYQHAFVYIRQLALLLRSALQKKTSEHMQQVYCWQYVYCCKLWVAVLANADNSDPLRSLVFPMSEILLGMCRMVPSPVRHLPLKFHAVRLLQQLAASTQTFIPTTSILMDILDWKEWSMKPKKTKSTGGVVNWQMSFLIRFPKDDPLRSHEQLEAAMSEFFLLLNREMELYRYSAGFPEYRFRVVQRLRKFSKETRSSRWRAFCRAAMDTCEKYAEAAILARSKLDMAPKDVKKLECLLPVGSPSMLERHSASVEKEAKRLSASLPTSAKQSPSESTDDVAEENEIAEGATQAKKRRKKAKTKEAKAVPRIDESALEQDDEVAEGIDWSDDEA